MYKNITISLLTATVAVLCLPELSGNEKAGLYVCMATCVFIFLLFLEELADKNHQKRMKKRKAELRMTEIIIHLREISIKEDSNAG